MHSKPIDGLSEKSPLRLFMKKMCLAYAESWHYLVTLKVVFIITFSIFPSVMVTAPLDFIDLVPDPTLRVSWTVLIFIFTYNIMDTSGRWFAGQSFGTLNSKAVLLLSYIRVAFIASSFLINYKTAPSWLFQADWFKLLNMALFAFTNGYCGTQCAAKATSQASDNLKDVVGSFVSVSMTLGIVIGSLVALATGPLLNRNQ